METHKTLKNDLENYLPQIRRIVQRVSRDDNLVDDITQECCVRIIEKESLWKRDRGTVNKWINALTRNLTIDFLKRQKKTLLLEDDVYNFPEEKMFSEDHIKWVLDQFGNLTKRQQEVLQMKYFKQMNTVEIAQKLNISQQTVSEHIQKGLDALKRKAKQQGLMGILLPWNWDLSILKERFVNKLAWFLKYKYTVTFPLVVGALGLSVWSTSELKGKEVPRSLEIDSKSLVSEKPAKSLEVESNLEPARFEFNKELLSDHEKTSSQSNVVASKINEENDSWQEKIPWGLPDGRGFQTRLIPLKSQFHLGESMGFRLEMRNISEQTFSLETRGISRYSLIVTCSNGLRKPLFKHNTSSTPSDNAPRPTAMVMSLSSHELQIKPGESVNIFHFGDVSSTFIIDEQTPHTFQFSHNGSEEFLSEDSFVILSTKDEDGKKIILEKNMPIPDSNIIEINILPKNLEAQGGMAEVMRKMAFHQKMYERISKYKPESWVGVLNSKSEVKLKNRESLLDAYKIALCRFDNLKEHPESISVWVFDEEVNLEDIESIEVDQFLGACDFGSIYVHLNGDIDEYWPGAIDQIKVALDIH